MTSVHKQIEPDSSAPTFLKTIRGIGYKLDATPVWEASADFCQCAICSATRMRTKAIPPGQVGRSINPQVRPVSMR